MAAISVQVGDLLMGVTADTRDAAAALARLLAPYKVDRAMPANYLISLAQKPTEFHRLAWGGCAVTRTLDPVRLARATARHIGGHGPPHDGLIRTDVVAVVKDGEATLLPSAVRRRLARFESPFRHRHFVVVDDPWSDIDPLRGTLEVGASALPEDCLQELATLAGPPRRTEPVVPAGSYPIAQWIFEGGADGEDRLPWPDAVVLALESAPIPVAAAPLVTELGELLRRVPCRMLPLGSPHAFALAMEQR